jgi:uncharacterized membrane protein
MLEKNESARDRLVRTVAGGGLLVASFTSLGVTSAKPLGVVVALIGAVLLFTAATGSCLLYKPLGVDTAKSK